MSCRTTLHSSVVLVLLLAAACQDAPTPAEPTEPDFRRQAAPQEVASWFRAAAPEVLELPQTVFADHDESSNQLVFGVEHLGVARGVQNVLTRRGIPASAYRIEVTEPIHFAASLRDPHRPTMGGLQIHFSNYLCTLGFSADHAGGRSFITNSHCTDQQGTTGSTTYYQPLSSVDSNPIGIEAHDPGYSKGGECSRGKQCRYSDAARVLYQSGVASLGEIAKTSGPNNGSLEVTGSFGITGQSNNTTFSGPVNTVGRTTGWTSGTVSNSCVTVNVSGSNIQLLCQTLVQRSGTRIVGSGDSGSPVFTGTGSVTLIGILWGGSSSGELFVFSPLKNIQDELGPLTATTDGTGGSDGGGGGGGGGDEPNCPPRSNSPKCQT